ncbi:hypothetical protein GCM10029964_101800 [Kibdelosporangium lantanae]
MHGRPAGLGDQAQQADINGIGGYHVPKRYLLVVINACTTAPARPKGLAVTLVIDHLLTEDDATCP